MQEMREHEVHKRIPEPDLVTGHIVPIHHAARDTRCFINNLKAFACLAQVERLGALVTIMKSLVLLQLHVKECCVSVVVVGVRDSLAVLLADPGLVWPVSGWPRHSALTQVAPGRVRPKKIAFVSGKPFAICTVQRIIFRDIADVLVVHLAWVQGGGWCLASASAPASASAFASASASAFAWHN